MTLEFLVHHMYPSIYLLFWVFMCGRPSVVYEPVYSEQHQEALGLLAYSCQLGVTEGNVLHSQIYGDFISLPDTGESGKGVWELHFTVRPVSNHDVELL